MKLHTLRAVVSVFLVVLLGCFTSAVQSAERDYHRIVVLTDLHLPYKTSVHIDPVKREKVWNAKKAAAEEVESWKDTDLLAVLGDSAGETGTIEEYQAVREFFGRFGKPVAGILGNHDFVYSDQRNEEGRFPWGTEESRTKKIQMFKDVFKLKQIFYTRELGNYLLIFLSPDMLKDNVHLTEISKQQLEWLSQTLRRHSAKQTLVFFHSPLRSTAFDGETRYTNTPNFIAQPEDKIDEIIKNNPQILAWVSGHIHLSPLKDGFHSDINYYAGRVVNIHNTDWDRERIWTRSIYLYQDRVVVKTYNHDSHAWEADKERTIISAQPKKPE